MEENIKNETSEIMPVLEEDLVEVSGGDDNDWHSWKLVEVKDGPNNSALCPYCAGVELSYDGRATLFNKRVWRFHCPKCSKKFIKIVDYGQWRVRI